ncbi:hypothetical protein KUTeg_002003 [Tegillarca granosa]|uniref:NR LBD domain-containing protein n=1 Tax=Tegillarca granosa TaxID=220873 RepID=A0ABQ9FUI0_TEGGR|nr:hypothetical protein KUTeg_002003 [Tegillarca granosa]
MYAVRNDRNKKKKLLKPEVSNSNSEDVTDDEHALLQDILDAHRATFPQMQEAALSPVSRHHILDASDEMDTDKMEESQKAPKSEKVILWEKVTEMSSKGIIKIVEFAKKIPGFATLSTSDQITLLKAACLEIMN